MSDKLKAVNKFLEKYGESIHPLFFLFVCILAFGLFIPFLGFYWDDWPTIFYTYSERISQLVNHFSYDRPFSVWAYWLVGLLGTTPIIWHLAALLLRWGSVVALAWALKPLWPKQSKAILITGLIFAIYPGYYLQPSSVIFIPHIAALGLFFVSLGAMGRAVTDDRRSWRYALLGLASAAVHMFTLEYFVGLELIRPLYLWLLLANRNFTTRPSYKQVFKLWAPYLALLALWMAWRLFLLQLPSEPYPLVFISELGTNPISALLNLAQTIARDLIYTLGIVWVELVQPASTQLDLPLWVLVAASAATVYFFLTWLTTSRIVTEPKERRFARQGLLLGLAAFLFGMFPVWAIGETIAQGEYNLRYILVAMLGAALVVGSMLTLLLPNIKNRVLIVSILAALAIGNHVHAANSYRLDWETQRAFYWQLFWRAPAFETNIALVSFTQVSMHLRDPMTGNALNVLYPLAALAPAVDLWNFELGRTETVRRIENGELLTSDYRGLTFTTQSVDDLVFYYLPPDGCVWVLTPLDASNELLLAEHRALVGHSNTANILAQPEGEPPAHVFGEEPQRNWCYYYEKAELARQLGDWLQVIALMAEARQQDFGTSYGREWLPLLEAYAATFKWSFAVDTSRLMHELQPANASLICAAWAEILAADPSPATTSAFEEVRLFAGCASP